MPGIPPPMPGTIPGMPGTPPNCAFAAGIDTTAAKTARERIRLNVIATPPAPSNLYGPRMLPDSIDSIFTSIWGEFKGLRLLTTAKRLIEAHRDFRRVTNPSIPPPLAPAWPPGHSPWPTRRSSDERRRKPQRNERVFARCRPARPTFGYNLYFPHDTGYRARSRNLLGCLLDQRLDQHLRRCLLGRDRPGRRLRDRQAVGGRMARKP